MYRPSILKKMSGNFISDEKKLKDMLCFLENVDYTYNFKSNIIAKMSDQLI